MVLINGKLSHDGTESTISRNIYFKYKSIPPDNFLAESNNITKIPADNTPDEIMEEHYPIFFTKKGMPLHLNIKKTAPTSYLISFFKTPLFYCTKN